MLLVRRSFLQVFAAALVPSALRATGAQAQQAGPKLTQILRADLAGQDQKVEETLVNILDLAPETGTPWHIHPGAQEVIYVLAGDVTVDVEGQGVRLFKPGDIVLIPAEVPHLARNESTSTAVKTLVTYSRSDKAKPFLVQVKRST